MNKEHSSARATNDDPEATTAAPRRIETPVPSSGVVVRSDGVSTGPRLQPPRPRPRTQASTPPSSPPEGAMPIATPAIPEGDGVLPEQPAPSQSPEPSAGPAAPREVVAVASGRSRRWWGSSKAILVGCLAGASVGVAGLLLAQRPEGGAASSGHGVVMLRKVDEIARVLRDRGLAECERQEWKDCAADLDEATTRDPEIGVDPRVQGALSTAQRHLREAF